MEEYLKFINTVGFKDKPDDGNYYECHHITPRCMDGADTADNLIYLSYSNHIRAHVMLSELFPGNAKLAFAVNALCNFTNTENRIFTEEVLEQLEIAKLTFIKNHPAKNPEIAKKFSGENSPLKKNKSSRLKHSRWMTENAIWRGKKRPAHSVAISGDKNGRAKQLVTPDGVFDTIIQASRSLGIDRNILAKLANNTQETKYYFINAK